MGGVYVVCLCVGLVLIRHFTRASAVMYTMDGGARCASRPQVLLNVCFHPPFLVRHRVREEWRLGETVLCPAVNVLEYGLSEGAVRMAAPEALMRITGTSADDIFLLQWWPVAVQGDCVADGNRWNLPCCDAR